MYNTIGNGAVIPTFAHPSPQPHTKAQEVASLLDSAINTCKIEPSQELFDRIFDRIYTPQSTIQETVSAFNAPMDKILTFVSGAIEKVQEMKEKERSANLMNVMELMQAKEQGEGKIGDE